MTPANLITNDPDLAVWMHPETFARFWKETDAVLFEAMDGTKFRTYAEAEAWAGRQ
jgi:uncharacterized protein (DUF2236 family)